MTNNYRIFHVLTPSETNTRFICHVLTPSELFVNVYNVQISFTTYVLSVLIIIYMADFSCKMNNK